MPNASIIHLPDGQNYSVTPVFSGFFFKSHELTTHPHAFPIGWTVVLHTEIPAQPAASPDDEDDNPFVRGYTKPTLQDDCLFISSISNPSSSDFKPAVSPTRQIAMILWVTLYWYFHQPTPSPILPPTSASAGTPEAGRPRGEWRINIRRNGVLRGRNLIPKLERMGLIASLETAAGEDDVTGVLRDHGWDNMFVSRRAFWQIPARLFLFTLQPNISGNTASFPGSPVGSRPNSPTPSKHLSLDGETASLGTALTAAAASPSQPVAIVSAPSFPIGPATGPFHSSSHLPTYYPPGPLQYIMTNGVRHPLRPKPPRTGEVFYTRFILSAGSYLSLRVASLSPRPVNYHGTVGPADGSHRIRAGAAEHVHLSTLPDTSLLQMWLAKPRVSAFWGHYSPTFLSSALAAKHSFPVIALWDGVPFAYLEIYWVKEDLVGRHVGPSVGDWDRGLHVLVGEEWARGEVQLWLSSVVHWIFTADFRTMNICVEPRVDNEKFIGHLRAGGFEKQTEVSLPHKQAWFGRLKRENWEGPAL